MTDNVYLESTIKSIDWDNGNIWIHKCDESQSTDFFATINFCKKTMSSEEFNGLKVDAKVKFKSYQTSKGSYIAQEISLIKEELIKEELIKEELIKEELIKEELIKEELIKEELIKEELIKEEKDIESQYIESTIKSIDLEKGEIWINKCNESQKSDFVSKKQFYEKTLSPEDLANLKVGTRVRFKKYNNVAQELDIVRNIQENIIKNNNKSIVNNVVKQITSTSEDFNLANSICDSLREKLKTVRKGADFEDITFLILKLLCISEVYTIPREEQGARPDGVFKCLNIATQNPKLEVVYDCTLKSKYEWEESKKGQVEAYLGYITKSNRDVNYTYEDRNGQLTQFKQNFSLSSNSDKQIWIITNTKDCTRLIENKQQSDGQNTFDIAIKEISIHSLIDILLNHLMKSDFVKIDTTTDKLRNLGKLA